MAIVAPDPLVCFAGSELRQSQKFNLDDSAGLILIDALTSGRRARRTLGVHHYESRTDIVVGGAAVYRDASASIQTTGRSPDGTEWVDSIASPRSC